MTLSLTEIQFVSTFASLFVFFVCFFTTKTCVRIMFPDGFHYIIIAVFSVCIVVSPVLFQGLYLQLACWEGSKVRAHTRL